MLSPVSRLRKSSAATTSTTTALQPARACADPALHSAPTVRTPLCPTVPQRVALADGLHAGGPLGRSESEPVLVRVPLLPPLLPLSLLAHSSPPLAVCPHGAGE